MSLLPTVLPTVGVDNGGNNGPAARSGIGETGFCAPRERALHQSGGLVVVGSNPAAPTRHQARDRPSGRFCFVRLDQLVTDTRRIIGMAESQVGRPSERGVRVASYRVAVEAFRAAGWTRSRIPPAVAEVLRVAADRRPAGHRACEGRSWRRLNRSSA